MKRIKCELGLKSLLAAAEHIEKYGDSWEARNANLAKRIRDEISHQLYLNLQNLQYNPGAQIVVRSGGNTQWLPYTSVPEVTQPIEQDYSTGDKATWIISIEGHDVGFIEFGAGVTYNGAVGSSPHPKGKKLGLTIGSYGSGKGALPHWGFYGDNGEVVITPGTPAQMPLYKAFEAVVPMIPNIVKEMLESDVYDGWQG